MTRSDNPFGDLPEWRERQLAQEQAANNGSPVNDPQLYPPQAAAQYTPPLYPDTQYQQPVQGGDDYGSAPAYHPNAHAPNNAVVGHPGHAQAPLHYEIGAQEQPVGYGHRDVVQHGGASAPQPPLPHYDVQATDTAGFAVPQYQEPVTAPPHYDPVPPSLDPSSLRGGQYDEAGLNHHTGPHEGQMAGGQYAADHYALGQANPGYDFSQMAPGQSAEAPPAYYEANAQHPGQWSPGAQEAMVAGQGHESDYLSEEDDYDDYEDEDEPQRYSWKLLAAVVVTGAVVAGGGVVLYDTLASGGGAKNGAAPIVRAERGPAKTVPKDAGGREFAHRDSKLLGRLDNSGGPQSAGTLDSESGNRVRTVPTVRIGRDGQLILPKAPEAVPAPGSQVASNTDAPTSVPGINVVESLSGNGQSGLGVLPPVNPKTQPAAAVPRPTVVPEVKPPVRPAATTPVIKNRGAVNKATVQSSVPPPVPEKSAVGTSWRMTASTAKEPPVAPRIRPTIAQSVVLPTSPGTAQVTTKSASTLGAGSVAQAQGRRYVAVLASAPTRMKALQSFAELQQKYPNALVNRVPDVRKVDLSDRGLGTMYRVVVGPAGTRGTANSVCSSLKSGGYSGCWVTAN